MPDPYRFPRFSSVTGCRLARRGDKAALIPDSLARFAASWQHLAAHRQARGAAKRAITPRGVASRHHCGHGTIFFLMRILR
ncbi:hypothetical protein E2C01_083576 [Portunus trituberculatus]|uniref:Uncharacterized protein n=1 Tax=Portunus trituberculatus TaxID=210409 RepID=A0A5B7IVJ8_PORTR|nr:hypothetical protein [Portunus trituberculatus]